MNWRTIRNIHYVPLIMACLCVSIIAFSISEFEEGRNTKNVIKLILPREKGGPDIFNAAFVLKDNRKRKIVEYILKGDENDDTKIALMRQTASQAKHSCDTMMWIKVHMRDDISYGTMVNLLNIMIVDQHMRYMLYNNDFYILPAVSKDCNEEEKRFRLEFDL